MLDSLKLSEFLELIKSTIEMSFGYDGFWVVAELSEWSKSGKHFYGELIEHDKINKHPIAKIRCNCWANIANYVLDKFFSATGEHLKSGIKVLFKVSVNYHTSFGLSLNIIDINPEFTLGDRQSRKIEIINTLTKKKIVNKNKDLSLPNDFTNIAVITSKTAAGKGDFFEEADKLNKFGLCDFDIYEAKMQGKDCATSVAEAFDNITKKVSKYDAIVIIRGGGSQADLDWFNNIILAESLCNSPLPVMVGIGHERDSTIIDDLCTKSFDTPSKAINHITNLIVNNASNASNNYNSIIKVTKNLANSNNSQLEALQTNIKMNLEHYLHNFEQKVKHNYTNIFSSSKTLLKLYENSVKLHYNTLVSNANNIIKHYTHTAESLYKQILSVSIVPTLNRGFSITKTTDNKYITNKKQAQKYSNLNIVYADGQINVEVKHGNTK